MKDYEYIVQEHINLHEALINKLADILEQASELKNLAEELNQENLRLKKILTDVLPMVTDVEFQLSLPPKYSELIKDIIGENDND